MAVLKDGSLTGVPKVGELDIENGLELLLNV
jgi:hypothetical protein